MSPKLTFFSSTCYLKCVIGLRVIVCYEASVDEGEGRREGREEGKEGKEGGNVPGIRLRSEPGEVEITHAAIPSLCACVYISV